MFPWKAEDLSFDETRFKGTVRLFPLPDLVMFPHVMQPLRIFEPRYRDLLNDALDSDGLIAMSVLSPGRKSKGTDSPPLLPYACLGKVVTHQRQDDGQYHVLLLGMRRVRIERELPRLRTFREAEVTLVDDFCYSENDNERAALQTALTEQFQECLPDDQSSSPGVRALLSTGVPLGVLTDLVSFAVPMELETKCELLAENDIDRRATTLLDALEHFPVDLSDDQVRTLGGYLPPFSEN